MAQLSVKDALAEATAGQLRPVYLVSGEERFLRQAVVRALRRAVVGDEAVSLNEDRFDTGSVSPQTLIAAARTLPMFGPRRLVLLHDLQRWEAQKDTATRGVSTKPLDRLAEYCQEPSTTTTLILIGEKLDSRRRLMTLAKKQGFLVACDPLSRGALPSWLRERAKGRGHELSSRTADLLAELVGGELSTLDDAVERLSLYVGKGAEITEPSVLECVAHLKSTTVWELVSAVGRRDTAGALSALGQVFERGSGPRLVGLLCWSARQMIRFGSARAAGESPNEAAKAAGIPPFKAQEVAAQLKHMPLPRAELWLEKLAAVDRALKGGSKMPPRAILEQALLEVCR